MPVKRQKNRVVEPITSNFDIQKRRASYFILILICFVVFGSSIFFEFIGLDDPTHIYENPHFGHPGLNSIYSFWKKDYFSLYIPVTYSIWTLIAKIAGTFSFPGALNHLSPQVFHLFNVIFHALNSCLVYHIIKKIFLARTPKGPVWAALIGALLFALHPVQIETVAWISEFKGLLSTFFSLLCIEFFLFRPHAKKWSVLWFVLAMLSKPSALVTPLFIVCIEVFVLEKKWQKSIQTALIWLILISPSSYTQKAYSPISI